MKHETHNNFISRTVRWLDRLGSQKQFLRKLVLDFDAICPIDCSLVEEMAKDGEKREARLIGYRDWYRCFDIGHLLRTVWAEDLQVTIEMIQPKADAYMQCMADHQDRNAQNPPTYTLPCLKPTQASRSI